MISIIIPTLNAEPWLAALLGRLDQQEGIGRPEVIVVDSASTDRTVEIARAHGARLIEIERAEFDHGGTRTLACGRARGDILVFLTQDALPVDQHTLARLVAPFDQEGRIGATYGRQLANSDATPFSHHLRLFNYPDTGYRRGWQDRQQYGFRTIFISNSCAAYRRVALEQVGFFPQRLLFGEDSRCLANILEQGWLVEYVAQAQVWHSHNYTLYEEFKRYFDIGVFHVSQQDLLTKFGSPSGAGKKFVLSEMRFLLHRKRYMMLPLSCARTLAKFTAYHLGRHHQMLPRRVAGFLSMHHRWWM